MIIIQKDDVLKIQNANIVPLRCFLRRIGIYARRLKRCSPAGHGALEEVHHLLSVLLQAIIEINSL